MEYSGICENQTCSFFPTERYTADEILQMITNHQLKSDQHSEQELITGRNLSKSVMNFIINLPEAHGDIQRGMEWIKIMSETAHFEEKELYITVCPGCNQVIFGQW